MEKIRGTMTIERAAGAAEDSEIAALGPWFHNLHLPDGRQTAPNHPLGDFPAFKWSQIAPHIPDDLEGWRVLDIGCNAGYYSVELAKRGASVLGIDVNPRYLKQAEWVAGKFSLQDRMEFRQMQVYDLLSVEEDFDLVLFLGVFYHLRYPMLGLDIVAQKVKRLMIFQTLMLLDAEIYRDTQDKSYEEREELSKPGWPRMSFIEDRFAGDPTNWWVPNRACVEALLRSAGMKITAHPENEIFVCEPDASNPSCIKTWDRAEFLSATRREWIGNEVV